MRLGIHSIARAAMIVLLAGQMSAQAATQTWNTTTGDWSEAANWTTAVPLGGDDVIITNRGSFVLLTNSTPWLGSMTISNATLACSNWNTTIYVTNLAILNSGILTCAGPFTNNCMSNRVSLTCSNLFVGSNGAINVNGKGYDGGLTLVNGGYFGGNGPGGGPKGTITGAGYGGAGIGNARFVKTNTYGSFTAPLDPGSGGSAGSSVGSFGGSGGGAVCITAVQVVVNGSISANGSNNVIIGSHNSGGSGGGIYITCDTITGTNGAIMANASYPQMVSLGGGAGGGRIAVHYNPESQKTLPVPFVSFSVAPSPSGGSTSYMPGDIGTLYFPDSRFFSPTNLFNGQWMAPGVPNLSMSEWVISNVWVRIPGIMLTVTNTLTIAGTNCEQFKFEFTNAAMVNCGQVRVSGATFGLGGYPYYRDKDRPFPMNGGDSGSTLNCTGDMILTNSARLHVYAGRTNASAAAEYGARVNVGGDLRLYSNSWIFPAAHPTNGAAVLFSMRGLTIDSGGGFNACVLGYAGGMPSGYDATNAAYGPGAPGFSCGAGYGGAGTNGYLAMGWGVPYGSSNAPIAPGSGARASTAADGYGPAGGGSVQIRATDVVAIQGAILANGTNGASSNGGGSSGGGIYITCRTFVGSSNGVLQADGGAGNAAGGNGGGGGGGGRIAVWRIFDRSTSVISNSVSGALGRVGSAAPNTSSPGTIVWGWLVPSSGSIVSIY